MCLAHMIMRLRSGTDTCTARTRLKRRPKTERTTPGKRQKHSVEQSVLVKAMATPSSTEVAALLFRELAAANAQLSELSAKLDELEDARPPNPNRLARITEQYTLKKIQINNLTQQLNRQREWDFEQKKMEHEEKKMEVQLEEKKMEVQLEQKKMEHEEKKMEVQLEGKKLDLRKRQIDYDREVLQATKKQASPWSTNTTRAAAPEAIKLIDYNGARELPELQELFVAIDRCLSDKLDRRSISLTDVPPPMSFHQPVDAAPLLVANKLKEEVQYKLLQEYVRALGPESHFVIDDDSNLVQFTNALGAPLKVDHAVMSRAMAGQIKTAFNIAFVVEQKISSPNHERTHLEGFSQLHTYMRAALRQSGPGSAFEPRKAKRTHIVGILIYRQPVEYQPPNDTQAHWTSPALGVALTNYVSKDKSTAKDGYSRLVADVYVLFHPAFMPAPHLLRLSSGVDAGMLFTALCSPTTNYAHLQRSFGMTAFTTVAMGGKNYKCVRYLGHGAIAEVWACRSGDVENLATDQEQEPRLRVSDAATDTGDDDSPKVHSEDLLVLKRTTNANTSLNHECAILIKLMAIDSDNAGVIFPRFVALSDDETCLLASPVCYQIITGGQLRRFALFDKGQDDAVAYLQRLGRLFVDYVTALETCHRAGIVHCDIALRNLMMTAVNGEARGCLIDWDCACEIDKESGMALHYHGRGSLETASKRVLAGEGYGRADDLIALVRCWKMVTQLATYKQVKIWAQMRGRPDHRPLLVEMIDKYWAARQGDLDVMAAQERYDALRAWFSNPTYIPA